MDGKMVKRHQHKLVRLHKKTPKVVKLEKNDCGSRPIITEGC